jgi:hypothetical protein
VVILGPPTRHDAEPGVAQLEAIDGEGFLVRFREWAYLDGDHASEVVSYLVLSPGRHVLADGSEWEVGHVDVSQAGAFVSHSFIAPFDAPPALFLTVQSMNDEAPLVVRVQNVDTTGFETAMMEEEGADGVHAAERVGYLAIRSPAGSGQLQSTSTPSPYLLSQVSVGHLAVPMLSGSLMVEEEASADPETEHAAESTSFLAIGSQVYAQTTTTVGTDPVAVRRDTQDHDASVEWGYVDSVGDGWRTVPLARSYRDPVVVVGPVSRDGSDPGVLRMRNVGADAFELRYQEWAYLNGFHGPERAFYLVAERGIQAIGGLAIEAGHLDSDLVLAEGWEEVTFAAPFTQTPGVFASVATQNDPQPVNLRVSDRTNAGFRMAMQSEEASPPGHGVERLNWVAIQSGGGTTSDGSTIRVFETSVNGALTPVPLGEGLRGRFPTVLGQVVSVVGRDPVELRFRDLRADSIGLVVEEEQSRDVEVGHAFEQVSVFLAD